MFSGNEFQNQKPPSSIKLTNWPMTICASLKRFFFDRDLKEDNVDNIFLHKYIKHTQKKPIYIVHVVNICNLHCLHENMPDRSFIIYKIVCFVLFSRVFWGERETGAALNDVVTAKRCLYINVCLIAFNFMLCLRCLK